LVRSLKVMSRKPLQRRVRSLLSMLTTANILGFNIKALNPSLRSDTVANNIEIINHSIIYKLIDDVIARLEKLLPPKIETTVTGEAEVRELFDITFHNKKRPIAGSNVFNGVISRKEKCRVTRNGRIIYSGMPSTMLANKRSLGYSQTFQKGCH
jgi:translation initiation factor IF-2